MPPPRVDLGFVDEMLTLFRQLGLDAEEPDLNYGVEGVLQKVTYTLTQKRPPGEGLNFINDMMELFARLGLYGAAKPRGDHVTYTVVQARPFRHT